MLDDEAKPGQGTPPTHPVAPQPALAISPRKTKRGGHTLNPNKNAPSHEKLGANQHLRLTQALKVVAQAPRLSGHKLGAG